MNEKNVQYLLARFPSYFPINGCRDIGVGDGWFYVLYDLFLAIELHRKRIIDKNDNIRQVYADLSSRTDAGYVLPEFKQAFEDGILLDFVKTVPTFEVHQIKEKFGDLRVYYQSNDQSGAIDALVTMAELRSVHTCEVCGDIGQLRNTRWIKCLCEQHYHERATENSQKEVDFNEDIILDEITEGKIIRAFDPGSCEFCYFKIDKPILQDATIQSFTGFKAINQDYGSKKDEVDSTVKYVIVKVEADGSDLKIKPKPFYAVTIAIG